nr:immunoglobulin light chain junction region [Macaca mulatta]MOW01857.1 immunoglobulin light chain junction region [Macaca mulatta]
DYYYYSIDSSGNQRVF